MSEHETVRDWLALSAAGLLEPGEERRVHEHAAACAECAAIDGDDAMVTSDRLSDDLEADVAHGARDQDRHYRLPSGCSLTR